MSICQACGGVIGRDCFNPQECMDITRDMADRYSVAESEAMEKDYQVHVLGQYIDHLRDRIEVMHELFADIRKAVGGNSLEFIARDKCPTCQGSGSVDTGGSTPWGAWITSACPHCNGSGKIHWCEACHGLGTPPGEAAGLVCGACNGTGIDSGEDVD